MGQITESKNEQGRRQTTYEGPGVRFTLHNSQGSSAKFGPCECCKKDVAATFYQTAIVRFTDDGEEGWTFHQAPKSLFGHVECLENARTKQVADFEARNKFPRITVHKT